MPVDAALGWPTEAAQARGPAGRRGGESDTEATKLTARAVTGMVHVQIAFGTCLGANDSKRPPSPSQSSRTRPLVEQDQDQTRLSARDSLDPVQHASREDRDVPGVEVERSPLAVAAPVQPGSVAVAG